MINDPPAMLSAIDKGKAMLDAVGELPPNTAASLRDKLALDWTYHSNAIEGNTLTLRETKVVLEGITVGGKSIREHLEVTNHREAIHYVEDIVEKNEPLSEWQIKNIHRLVLSGIDDAEAGRYRRENVAIAGASTTPPAFLYLPEKMASLLTWYGDTVGMHPVERAAVLHAKFEEVHPFIDGNGRTGRLLINLELMKAGFAPAVIRKEDRLAYYDALDAACTKANFGQITLLVGTAVQNTLDLYLDLLEPSIGDTRPGQAPP